MNNDTLTQIRLDYQRRYRRRLFWRRLRWIARDLAYYTGTVIASTIVAVAYIAAIAILCGF